MFEELMIKGENITDSPHQKIMILKNEVKHGWNKMLAESERIIEKSKSYDSEMIKKSLTKLVPEYTPDNTDLDNYDFIRVKNKNL